MTEGLTCRELIELVTEYLDGTLSEEERARFDEHLAICEGCTTYLDQIRTTIEIAGNVREEDLSPEAQRELLEAFRSWKSRQAT